MSALPPSQMRAMRLAVQPEAAPVISIETRWDALQMRADEVAALAQLAPERGVMSGDALIALFADVEEWQVELAQRAIEDLDALMDKGLTALGTLVERGNDTTAPALALWREFYHGREAVLSLLRPHPKAA
ncbi:hypothetical protein [Erythrobacter sp. NAP1]|uniref:hypothetical protein n=1 Tax=Erythrobacter sp. NAP1 TaxID=237727 RepID=UPI000325B537|nr:hypothetical protein [Erythrobacter sp. NAP1]